MDKHESNRMCVPGAVFPKLNDEVRLEQALVVIAHRILCTLGPFVEARVAPPDAVCVCCVHRLNISQEVGPRATAAGVVCGCAIYSTSYS